MFKNLTWVILIYYVLTVFLVVSGLYYFVVVLGFQELFPIIAVTFVLTALMGMLMATLALEPLREHFSTLEQYTKETLHELNLPVNTITANAAMLKKNQDDPKVIKRIERIEKAAQMLQQRYGELDYLIKKQMRKEQIETFDLEPLVKERVELLETLYNQITFELLLAPLTLKTDAMGLAKVIDNLIENGVKYSADSNKITIVLEGSKLEIRDYGSGMDEATLLHIFDRYYQNDANMPGFGIGLGLVKSYCDRHRIGLHVTSKKEFGTTVSLNFKEVLA